MDRTGSLVVIRYMDMSRNRKSSAKKPVLSAKKSSPKFGVGFLDCGMAVWPHFGKLMVEASGNQGAHRSIDIGKNPRHAQHGPVIDSGRAFETCHGVCSKLAMMYV